MIIKMYQIQQLVNSLSVYSFRFLLVSHSGGEIHNKLCISFSECYSLMHPVCCVKSFRFVLQKFVFNLFP